ncbi:MAG: M28 family peptidase [Bacteroidota bacterium]
MLAGLAALLAALAVGLWSLRSTTVPTFDGDRAYDHVLQQVAFGPRIPGSEGHDRTRQWLVETLTPLADRVLEQPFTSTLPDSTTVEDSRVEGTNIVASFNLDPGVGTRIMLCAHWDTRPHADRDPDPAKHREPVLGANDGGSGVAVLLEMARLLAADAPDVGVDLILFDLEDSGTYDDDTTAIIPFAIGSAAFVRDNPTYRPTFGLLVDLVGDTDLRIPREAYSQRYAPRLVDRVWAIAERIGADAFVDTPGGAITDDHVPFLRAGIPVIDLIHQPFPNTWHTTRDTPEHVSPTSLAQVGQVLAEVVYSE